jgi:hypothetical protein
VTITNGYCDLDEFKAYATARGQTMSTSAADDANIDDIIESASRTIDTETMRTFYGRSEVRLFDVPDNSRELRVDDDLLAVDTLTNGDGTEITSTDYILLPANTSPKYVIKLKQSSAYYWTFDGNGNTEQVISVDGTWGYSSSAPADIKDACLEIALADYRSRLGENMQGVAQVTGAGVVITPKALPQRAYKTIMRYRKHL